jgi:hypothetical protein
MSRIVTSNQPGPLTFDITVLPPNLVRSVRLLEANIVAVNDRLGKLEPELAADPQNKALQERWKGYADTLAALNDTVELLNIPIVRMAARAKYEARRQALTAQPGAAK